MYRLDHSKKQADDGGSVLAPEAQPPTIGVADLVERLVRGWRLIAASVLVALAVGLLAIVLSTPRYRAEMVVIPAPVNDGPSLRGAGALGGIASLAGINLNAGQPVAPFDVFRAVLVGPDVARDVGTDEVLRVVFADRWDPAKRQWRPPGGLGGIGARLSGLLGLPDTRDQPPDWRSFQKYLERTVKSSKGIDTPVWRISYEHADPAFASRLLLALHAAADSHVRARDKARAEANIEHLAMRLENETRAENRLVLAASLAEQERVLMMASGETPYAAELVGAVTVTRDPVTPNVPLILAAALLAGLLAGSLLVLSGRSRSLRA